MMFYHPRCFPLSLFVREDIEDHKKFNNDLILSLSSISYQDGDLATRQKAFDDIYEKFLNSIDASDDIWNNNIKDAERFIILSDYVKSNSDIQFAKQEFIYAHSVLNRVKYHQDLLQWNEAARLEHEFFMSLGGGVYWISGETLVTRGVPLISEISNLRDHCLFLAWRLAFLYLECGERTFSTCITFETLFKAQNDNRHVSSSYEDTFLQSVQKSKKMYQRALTLICNIVPHHLKMSYGNLQNASMSISSVVVPEMNPFTIRAMYFLVQCHVEQLILFEEIYKIPIEIDPLNDNRYINVASYNMKKILAIVSHKDYCHIVNSWSLIARMAMNALECFSEHVWRGGIENWKRHPNLLTYSSNMHWNISHILNPHNHPGLYFNEQYAKCTMKYLLGTALYYESLMNIRRVFLLSHANPLALKLLSISCYRIDQGISRQYRRQAQFAELLFWCVKQTETFKITMRSEFKSAIMTNAIKNGLKCSLLKLACPNICTKPSIDEIVVTALKRTVSSEKRFPCLINDQYAYWLGFVFLGKTHIMNTPPSYSQIDPITYKRKDGYDDLIYCKKVLKSFMIQIRSSTH